MGSYFPIPPNIKIGLLEHKIIGSLTLLNYPNNHKKNNEHKISKKDIYVGIYILRSNLWFLCKIEKCGFKEFKEITRDNLAISDYEMAVAVIKKINNFPKSCDQLPIPDTLRIDKAPVAERTSFNFSYKNFQTSFQGEFPIQMAKLSHSTFFGFDALKGIGDKSKIKNFILLMNLNISSKRNNMDKVKIYDPNTKKVLYELMAKENLISVHDISELYDNNFLQKILFLSSKSFSYIALMMSLDLNSKQFSLEHTHPPAEMANGMDRYQIVKPLKKNWII
tara:strand:- start:2223 stop:3059 length:837 start_codon:yes stop_codon:yes gene_type:complete